MNSYFDCQKCGGSFAPQHKWCPKCDQVTVEHTEALNRFSSLMEEGQKMDLKEISDMVKAVPLPPPDTTQYAQWKDQPIKYHSVDQIIEFSTARVTHALRNKVQPIEQQGEPVAPVLIALAWSKARNAWMQASRHGTQEAADLLAIAELTHYIAIPDQRIAALESLLRDIREEYRTNGHLFTTAKRIEAALGGSK